MIERSTGLLLLSVGDATGQKRVINQVEEAVTYDDTFEEKNKGLD